MVGKHLLLLTFKRAVIVGQFVHIKKIFVALKYKKTQYTVKDET